MASTKQQREYAKKYYWRKKKELMKEKEHQLNGHSNGKAGENFLSAFKAYQTLYNVIDDGQVKTELTKVFANIVIKIAH